MLGTWMFFLSTSSVPELDTEPWRIGFHLVAEFVTAVALLVSGAALIAGHTRLKNLDLVSIGMLIYTVLNSPGYFAQQGDWALVALFAALLVLALVSLAQLFRQPPSPYRGL